VNEERTATEGRQNHNRCVFYTSVITFFLKGGQNRFEPGQVRKKAAVKVGWVALHAQDINKNKGYDQSRNVSRFSA